MDANEEARQIAFQKFKGLIVECVVGRSGRSPDTIEKTLITESAKFTASDVARALVEVEVESLAPFGKIDSGRQARFDRIKGALNLEVSARDFSRK